MPRVGPSGTGANGLKFRVNWPLAPLYTVSRGFAPLAGVAASPQAAALRATVNAAASNAVRRRTARPVMPGTSLSINRFSLDPRLVPMALAGQHLNPYSGSAPSQ